jgi:hypothetical protein
MAKPVDGKSKGFGDGIKVFSMAARARTIIGNSIFFHTTIIANNEFLVNLFKQDHGHDYSLSYKTCADGNNV